MKSEVKKKEVKTKMKKQLMSIMVIGIASLMLGAGTFALFSDTETSTGNTFTAGTLDIKVGGQDDGDTVWTFDETDMKPGTEGSHTFVVTNAGTIPGMLSIEVTDIVNLPGTTPEPEPTPDTGDLGAAIWVILFADFDEDGWIDDGEGIYVGYLDGLGGPYLVGQGVLPVDIVFYWSIHVDVGNEIMDDSVSFDIVFSLAQ